MPDVPVDALGAGGDDDAAELELIERERATLRSFVAGLSPDEIKSGSWFTKLIAQALKSYTEKVNWHLWVPRIPSTQLRPLAGIHGSARRSHRCDATLPPQDHRLAAVSPP